MENAMNKDLPIGIYRTNDEIKNLRIKVKVKKIANACFTSQDSLELKDPNEIELVNLIKSSSALVEKTISWQEKAEKKAENNGAKEKEAVTIVIFTYTDADILSEKWRKERSITHPASRISYLEQNVTKTKPKLPMHFHDFETWQKPPFSSGKEIVKKNTSKHALLPIGQSMLIMAALFFEDSSTTEEFELVSLYFDQYGTLTVIPDFCRNKTFTFLNSRSETFEYEFENISGMLKEADILREKSFMRKIELQKMRVISEAVGSEFHQVTDNTVSFLINCEIVSAKNFFYDDIFVHYLIVVPQEWNSESCLEGTTETCRSKRKDKDDIAYFGYPFSLDVNVTEENLTSILPLLKVIIEVTSVDYWGNFKNEGYGYTDIILTPGTVKSDIATWKLEPTTLKSRLQNFFIGGIPCLEDLLYVINPHETKDSQLSKYGVQTVSSGMVTFNYSVLRQSKVP